MPVLGPDRLTKRLRDALGVIRTARYVEDCEALQRAQEAVQAALDGAARDGRDKTLGELVRRARRAIEDAAAKSRPEFEPMLRSLLTMIPRVRGFE